MFLKIGKKISIIHDQLRFKKDIVFRYVIKIIPSKVTPNQITAGRLILVFIWLLMAIVQTAWWQVIIFFIVYFFDLVDGALARIRNQKTKFGFHFDPLTDRFNHLILYFTILKLTAGQLSVLWYFIIWEIVAMGLIIVEIITSQQKILYWRVFGQVVVKISLWLALIYQFGNLYLSLW